MTDPATAVSFKGMASPPTHDSKTVGLWAAANLRYEGKYAAEQKDAAPQVSQLMHEYLETQPYHYRLQANRRGELRKGATAYIKANYKPVGFVLAPVLLILLQMLIPMVFNWIMAYFKNKIDA